MYVIDRDNAARRHIAHKDSVNYKNRKLYPEILLKCIEHLKTFNQKSFQNYLFFLY